MLYDLIRALLAAVVAGVAPGYFWAACLCAGSGEARAERLIFGSALSMALVPAVALVPAGLLGTGVTLAVAAGSASFVFFSGLVAYLAFGPAKGPGGPLLARPAPLGFPALALLLPALGLALAAFFGFLDGARSMLPVAILVLFAGAAQLLEVREPAPPRTEPPRALFATRAGTARRLLRRLLLPVVLLAVLARGYLGPVLHDWPYLRGGDQYSHAVMANMMLTEGSIASYAVYPPGLHTLNAVLSRFSGLEPLELFPVLAPAMYVLPALSLYVLGRRLWGWGYGVAAAALGGLLPNGIYLYLGYQAMYPTVVSAQFLLVLATCALVGLYASPTLRNAVLLALLGSAIVLYHQVGSLYAALLLGSVVVLILPHLLLHERRTGLALLGSLALMFSFALTFAWDTYGLPELTAGLLGGSGTGAGGEAVAMAVGTQAPLAPEHLLVTATHPLLWLGLLGAVLLAARARDEPRHAAPARATLLLWALVLFAGSRTALSGFPERFERDLGVPLALFGVFALGALLATLRAAPRGRPATLGLAAVALALALLGAQAVRNLEAATGPSNRVVLTPEIAEAGKWLEARNAGGNIAVAPRGNQVPGRAMLALSGHTALEAFTRERISYNRDLPPYGAGPLLDVLWIVEHPEGERTRQLIEKHDVRYVVFYKRFAPGTTWDRTPVVDWRGHEAADDHFQVAFENGHVIIFRPTVASTAAQTRSDIVVR
jgi:hypothetical protein